MYRPRLRAHLRVEGDQLADDLLKRSYPLVGAMAAVVPRLDGETAWDDVQAAVVAGGATADDAGEALRRLFVLHAIEGAGDAMVAKLGRVLRREESVPTSILEGARFACQGSGACCQGYAFGPLTDADVARLEALDLAAAFPAVAAPYYETHAAGRYLRRDGERCVFLGADQRCGIHAAFGADAKPGFCRLYPLDSFGTVEGIRIVDRGTCATFGVSARTGLPLVDDLERVRPLLAAPALHHPVVLVDEWAWDYGLFLRFTTAATTMVRANRAPAAETLHAIGRLLDALALATARCPLAPGQPDAIVGSILALPDTAWYRPSRREADGVRALVELLRALSETVTAALARNLIGSAAARVRSFSLLVDHTADTLDDGPGAPPPPPAADVDEALRLSLRQQLFGRHLIVNNHAGAGLARIAIIQLLALAAARLDAGPRPLTAADLSRGHMLTTRAFGSTMLDDTLAAHDPRWRLLLDGLPAAARAFRG